MEYNIIGQIVLHKAFGKGEICDFTDNIIKISFQTGERDFVFPDAFELYLKATDENFHNYVKTLIEEKKIQEEKEKVEKERIERENALINSKINKTSAKKNKKKKEIPRENIAFKCNFCDGGKSDEQVGYASACSDDIIYNNIVIENKTWCRSLKCPCFQYNNNEITRKDLDSYCNDGGFVCYESQMLREWKAYAGIVQSGERKGEPMKLNKVQCNSLCVLTTRDPQMVESERYIFAVFLVDETYSGDERDEGYVGTRSKYKIKLSPKECKSMLFWKYHKNGNSPKKSAWNSGLHRYFDDEMAAQILIDIVNIKKGTKDEVLASEFLKYFCEINEIDINKVKNPSGALTL